MHSLDDAEPRELDLPLGVLFFGFKAVPPADVTPLKVPMRCGLLARLSAPLPPQQHKGKARA